MATITQPAEAEAALATEYPPHRMTIERYEKLAQSGVYGDKEPVFLWRGRLVEKMTKGRKHSRAGTKLHQRLIGLVPVGWYVEHEQPIEIADDGMPEPDLAVIRGSIDDDRDRAASSKKVALIVEIADSSLAVDSSGVLEAYAREAIPIYWIVNIPKGWIEVHTEPTGPGDRPSYRERRLYLKDEELPVVVDGHDLGRILVREILD